MFCFRRVSTEIIWATTLLLVSIHISQHNSASQTNQCIRVKHYQPWSSMFSFHSHFYLQYLLACSLGTAFVSLSSSKHWTHLNYGSDCHLFCGVYSCQITWKYVITIFYSEKISIEDKSERGMLWIVIINCFANLHAWCEMFPVFYDCRRSTMQEC